MVKPFEDAAFSQKINEIGPVVETQFGYHIIQMQERTKAKSKNMDDVKPEIIKTLQEQNKQKAVKDYMMADQASYYRVRQKLSIRILKKAPCGIRRALFAVPGWGDGPPRPAIRNADE